jgi:hypothetical protein
MEYEYTSQDHPGNQRDEATGTPQSGATSSNNGNRQENGFSGQDFMQILRQMAQSQAQAQAATNQQIAQLIQAQTQAAAQTSSGSHQRKIDLPKYNGDRSVWPTWKIQALNAIAVDGPQIGNNARQVAYLFNHLIDNASKNMTTWMNTYGSRADGTCTGTPATFLEEMERLYGDPALMTRSYNLLQTLSQGEKESFNAFYPKFETIMANAGLSSTPEHAKVGMLQAALNARFQAAVPATKIYISYAEFVSDLQNAAAKFAGDNARIRTRTGRYSSGRITAQAPISTMDPDAMDWTAARITNATTQGNCKRATWVSQEVIQKRRKARVCLRCGNSGHFIRDCKFAPAQDPNRTNQRPHINRVELQADTEYNEDIEDNENAEKE